MHTPQDQPAHRTHDHGGAQAVRRAAVRADQEIEISGHPGGRVGDDACPLVPGWRIDDRSGNDTRQYVTDW